MFAATLFCSKLVAYVFLYWLPYYLNAIPIGGKRLTPQVRAWSGTLKIHQSIGH